MAHVTRSARVVDVLQVVSYLLTTCINLVSTLLIGHFLGHKALDAVGASFLVFLCFSFSIVETHVIRK